MLARKYKSIVKSIFNPVQGVYTIEFESQERPYKFLPGQFLHLSLDSAYDGIGQWPESRCFSIQTNPKEDNIKITYSIKGAFTKQMEKTLKEGTEIWLKLPYGDLFQQNHNKTNTVFIAGGTGITPFLSLFTHNLFEEYKNPKIYIGFRSQKYNIYKNELEHISNSTKTLKLMYQNIQGILDINEIFEENGEESCYFISGPPSMINNFRNYLILNYVSIQNILTDDWV